MITLTSKMDILDNHMRICLKDVSTMQIEVGNFKEKCDSELKQYNDHNQLAFSQTRLAVKQNKDMLSDLQK